MGEAYILRRGGSGNENNGIKLPANTSALIAKYNADNNFIVPITGRYRITVIGHGGSGGSGEWRAHEAGSSGGAAQKIIDLEKGSSIAITVSNGTSSFGSYISADAGGSTDSNGPGPVGTTAGGDPEYSFDGHVCLHREQEVSDVLLDNQPYIRLYSKPAPYTKKEVDKIPWLSSLSPSNYSYHEDHVAGEPIGSFSVDENFSILGNNIYGLGGIDSYESKDTLGFPGVVIVEYIVPDPSILTVQGNNIEISNSANAPFAGFSIYGKTTQKGVPTLEKPVPLNTIGEKGDIKILIPSGAPPRPVAFSTPGGLPGIPVTSGGNYTDSTGQQWICDEMDLESGVYIKRLNKMNSSSCTSKIDAVDMGGGFYRHRIALNAEGESYVFPALCNKLPWKASYDEKSNHFYCDGYNAFAIINHQHWFDNNNLDMLYVLKAPQATPLSSKEISAYKALHTYDPTTTITNDESAWMKVAYRIKE